MDGKIIDTGIVVRDGVCNINGVLVQSYMEYNINKCNGVDIGRSGVRTG